MQKNIREIESFLKCTAGMKIKKSPRKKLVKSNKSKLFFREIALLAVLQQMEFGGKNYS